MIVNKKDYINNLVNIYESLLNQSIKMVERGWDDIEKNMNDVDFLVVLSDDEQINRDFEEQYVMTILGALNMAAVRTGLGPRISPRNTEVDVVEFMLNEETRCKTEETSNSTV